MRYCPLAITRNDTNGGVPTRGEIPDVGLSLPYLGLVDGYALGVGLEDIKTNTA